MKKIFIQYLALLLISIQISSRDLSGLSYLCFPIEEILISEISESMASLKGRLGLEIRLAGYRCLDRDIR